MKVVYSPRRLVFRKFLSFGPFLHPWLAETASMRLFEVAMPHVAQLGGGASNGRKAYVFATRSHEVVCLHM